MNLSKEVLLKMQPLIVCSTAYELRIIAHELNMMGFIPKPGANLLGAKQTIISVEERFYRTTIGMETNMVVDSITSIIQAKDILDDELLMITTQSMYKFTPEWLGEAMPYILCCSDAQIKEVSNHLERLGFKISNIGTPNIWSRLISVLANNQFIAHSQSEPIKTDFPIILAEEFLEKSKPADSTTLPEMPPELVAMTPRQMAIQLSKINWEAVQGDEPEENEKVSYLLGQIGKLKKRKGLRLLISVIQATNLTATSVWPVEENPYFELLDFEFIEEHMTNYPKPAKPI